MISVGAINSQEWNNGGENGKNDDDNFGNNVCFKDAKFDGRADEQRKGEEEFWDDGSNSEKESFR